MIISVLKFIGKIVLKIVLSIFISFSAFAGMHYIVTKKPELMTQLIGEGTVEKLSQSKDIQSLVQALPIDTPTKKHILKEVDFWKSQWAQQDLAKHVAPGVEK